MRILVVCGAGASSTFVAQRVRRSARDRGLDCTVEAAGSTRLDAGLDAVDVVLLGAHVGTLADAVRERASEASVAAAATADLLPRMGRARPHAEKSLGTPDPGAHSFALIVTAVGETLAAASAAPKGPSA